MADVADTGALTNAVSGALATSYAVAALFFAKFRRRTGATIFTWFATAFVLLAVQRVVLIAVVRDPDTLPWSYVLRLVAFVLILAGIAAHNRSPRERT